MAKAVKFNDTYFELGVPKYEAGKIYPATDETMRQVALGHAEEANAKPNEIEADPAQQDGATKAAEATPEA